MHFRKRKIETKKEILNKKCKKNAYQKRGLTVNYWQKQHLLFFAGQTDIQTRDQLSKLSIVNTIQNKRMQKKIVAIHFTVHGYQNVI